MFKYDGSGVGGKECGFRSGDAVEVTKIDDWDLSEAKNEVESSVRLCWVRRQASVDLSISESSCSSARGGVTGIWYETKEKLEAVPVVR